ncbi:hypothetical protein SAMD00019534_011380 [Acytostelium subglobosum LB1]|uniref:hypothetical protein n=1 Tax=Acytostelium subglobosum LB1 TaxID=1410327 RepID=UPI00064490B1|nr:hypothetical protein SAMD00019534_011380 [Acytostelium subglobosum LB1]GAM17963.1 hypothetical protein SAMD00019534_011380 [Acytostelium subglobosum LB1]|eukprot:XP_012758559.1 hypothetical protein SAMD00019534_011380 [Acytostelium subglobosum LB1]
MTTILKGYYLKVTLENRIVKHNGRKVYLSIVEHGNGIPDNALILKITAKCAKFSVCLSIRSQCGWKELDQNESGELTFDLKVEVTGKSQRAPLFPLIFQLCEKNYDQVVLVSKSVIPVKAITKIPKKSLRAELVPLGEQPLKQPHSYLASSNSEVFAQGTDNENIADDDMADANGAAEDDADVNGVPGGEASESDPEDDGSNQSSPKQPCSSKSSPALSQTAASHHEYGSHPLAHQVVHHPVGMSVPPLVGAPFGQQQHHHLIHMLSPRHLPQHNSSNNLYQQQQQSTAAVSLLSGQGPAIANRQSPNHSASPSPMNGDIMNNSSKKRRSSASIPNSPPASSMQQPYPNHNNTTSTSSSRLQLTSSTPVSPVSTKVPPLKALESVKSTPTSPTNNELDSLTFLSALATMSSSSSNSNSASSSGASSVNSSHHSLSSILCRDDDNTSGVATELLPLPPQPFKYGGANTMMGHSMNGIKTQYMSPLATYQTDSSPSSPTSSPPTVPSQPSHPALQRPNGEIMWRTSSTPSSSATPTPNTTPSLSSSSTGLPLKLSQLPMLTTSSSSISTSAGNHLINNNNNSKSTPTSPKQQQHHLQHLQHLQQLQQQQQMHQQQQTSFMPLHFNNNNMNNNMNMIDNNNNMHMSMKRKSMMDA